MSHHDGVCFESSRCLVNASAIQIKITLTAPFTGPVWLNRRILLPQPVVPCVSPGIEVGAVSSSSFKFQVGQPDSEPRARLARECHSPDWHRHLYCTGGPVARARADISKGNDPSRLGKSATCCQRMASHATKSRYQKAAVCLSYVMAGKHSIRKSLVFSP